MLATKCHNTLLYGRYIKLAAVLLATMPMAYALEPQIDPARPSSQPLKLPEPASNHTNDGLKLPTKTEGMNKSLSRKDGILQIHRIRFEGNKVIPVEELLAIARPFLDRPLKAIDLEQLRHELSLHYVRKGYINSGAQIPEQNIQSGELLVQIIEGHLSDIKITDVTGQTSPYRLWGLRDGYIRDRLMPNGTDPLNTVELQEKYTRLLNDRLIERLNGTLLPGLHPGESVLDLKVVRARPYGGYLGVDNYAPPQIGGISGKLGIWADNLTTMGDRIDFNIRPSQGAFSYNTGLELPLSSYGTRFGFRYSNAETSLIEPPENVGDFTNNILSYDAQLSHPVLWDLKNKLTLGANFAVRQNLSLIAGEPFIEGEAKDGWTTATVVRTWQDYLNQSDYFDLAMRSTFSMGIDALGATIPQDNSAGIGSGEFFAWLGQGSARYRVLDNGAYISASGAVQLTPNRLLSLEKMALGGFGTIRGFRQNYLVKDEGFYVSLDLGYPVYGGGSSSRYGVFIVPFTDYGGGGNQDNNYTYLQSVGLGLEGYLKVYESTLSTSLYWAGRLSDNYRGNRGSFGPGKPYDLQDNGINFEVNLSSF
jgi:hemolysin activation/secretion protein